MIIRADQFASHLQQVEEGSLAPVDLISSDAPLLLQ